MLLSPNKAINEQSSMFDLRLSSSDFGVSPIKPINDGAAYSNFLAAMQGLSSANGSSNTSLNTINLNQNSFRHSKELPAFGCKPSTVFCRNCQRLVHTNIDFQTSKGIRKSVLSVVANLFDCCSGNSWLNRWRVHLCSDCGETIGIVSVQS